MPPSSDPDVNLVPLSPFILYNKVFIELDVVWEFPEEQGIIDDVDIISITQKFNSINIKQYNLPTGGENETDEIIFCGFTNCNYLAHSNKIRVATLLSQGLSAAEILYISAVMCDRIESWQGLNLGMQKIDFDTASMEVLY